MSNPILEKLIRFKRSLYWNLFLGSTILSLALLLSFFIVISISEYFFWFSPTVRALLFYSYLLVFVFLFVTWVILPALRLYITSLQISNESAAQLIGEKISSISDKLLNTIQLLQNKGELAQASVSKNVDLFLQTPFEIAIEKEQNFRYARLLLAPLAILLLLLSCDKNIILSSANRIYNHNQSFSKPLPYKVELLTKNLVVIENNDLEVVFLVSGKEVPDFFEFQATDGRNAKILTHQDTLRYLLKSITKDLSFHLATSEFASPDYPVKVLKTPKVMGLVAHVKYPAHTGMKSATFVNTYSYTVPFGSEITLKINAQNTDSIKVENLSAYKSDRNANLFEVKFRAMESSEAVINLFNQNPTNPAVLALDITVENDKAPYISMTYLYDSLNRRLTYYGKISDDYGFSSLSFSYKIENENFTQIKLDLQDKTNQQSYYGVQDFEKINQDPKKSISIEFYAEVSDNDIFRRKTSKTPTYRIVLLSKEELQKQSEKQVENSKEEFNDIKNDAFNVKKELEELQKKLMLNRKLEWNDLKRVEELKKDQNKLENRIKELDKNINQLSESQKKMNDIKDERLLEKMEQVQKLMDELLDDRTKELYEQLQQAYEQKLSAEEMEKLLEKIKNQTSDLEKELDKALEYFKKLQFEVKSKELAKTFEKLSEKQDSLAERQFNEKKIDPSQKLEEQKELNQELKDALEQVDSLKQDAQEMNEPLDMKQEEELKQELDKDSKELEQNLKQQDSKPSNKERQETKSKQQQMSKKMKQMAENLQNNMQGAEQEQLEEDIASLTRTLENLIKASYEQEETMLGLKKIRSIDPNFNKLSLLQLKIKSDFELIKDSLEALASRVMQIKPFVSEEVRKVDEKIETAMDHLKNKRIPMATVEQQGAMTSLNNLAVMLSEILEQMQNESNSQGSSSGNKKKSNKNQKPSLSELQQSLNQQIENLKKSGKSGRELSEELRKLAVQQEMIRQMMKEKGNKPGQNTEEPGKDGKGGNKMDKLMQDSKNDLINKRVTDQLLQRQKEILTRLLESEKAERERGMKEEREAERPKDNYEQIKDILLEKYLKEKQQQIEEIQKKSPAFLPFYKNNIQKYNLKISQ
jgi:hypothetical protein